LGIRLKRINKLTDRILLFAYVPIGILIAAFAIFGNYIGVFNLELTLLILIFAMMLLFFAGITSQLNKIEKRLS